MPLWMRSACILPPTACRARNAHHYAEGTRSTPVVQQPAHHRVLGHPPHTWRPAAPEAVSPRTTAHPIPP